MIYLDYLLYANDFDESLNIDTYWVILILDIFDGFVELWYVCLFVCLRPLEIKLEKTTSRVCLNEVLSYVLGMYPTQ